MHRRLFLQHTVAAGLSLVPASRSLAARNPRPDSIRSRWVPSATIRDYLCREAARITDAAGTAVSGATAWRRLEAEKRRQFVEMLGLSEAWTETRTPPPVTITGRLERDGYRIEKLYFESWPGLQVTANLYLPTRAPGPAPAVLYVCGHSRQQKVAFQAHARRFAELGFVCLIVETIQLGEVEGFHHGAYREGWWQWYSRGYCSSGIETLNGMRALDLLVARPEVDPNRLGVTGISGGGAVSWWIAAADPRIRVAAPVCGTATLYSHLHDRTIDGHCDCMWWVNTYRWDMADVGALIAPRPLLVASADKDGIFTIESIRRIHAQLDRVYRKLGARRQLRLVETPGGHSYHPTSRTEIFSWFLRHLQGREVPPHEVGDIDERPERQESAETLRVFVHGVPESNRTARIQDDFFRPAAPPALSNAAALEAYRGELRAKLREKTFGAFPERPPALDVQIEHEFDEDAAGHRFGFTSEDGWRLHAQWLRRKPLQTPPSSGLPAVIAPRLPGEGRWDTRSLLLRLAPAWGRVALDVRGVGDTAWAEDLHWHLRRAAAWTGRTIASMRTWDVLRALAAVRQLPGVDPDHVALLGRGEMAVPVLYAALLDGQVRTVFLIDPPATQNVPGEKDGRGPDLEMLNCLRFTDLPQVAGLLWPTELVFVGSAPSSYAWAETLYQTLGQPGRVRRLRDLGEWRDERLSGA